MIGNEKRIFVGRNFSVFQNRARWSTSGSFVVLPDRAEPNIELRNHVRNAEMSEDPSDRIVLLFANSHYNCTTHSSQPTSPARFHCAHAARRTRTRVRLVSGGQIGFPPLAVVGIVRAVQKSRFFSCANPGFVLVTHQ